MDSYPRQKGVFTSLKSKKKTKSFLDNQAFVRAFQEDWYDSLQNEFRSDNKKEKH